MDTRDAVELIREAIPRPEGDWADLGCGDGGFTRALAELMGADGRIYALDRDARAISALERWGKRHAPRLVPIVADLTRPFELPGLGERRLAGILMANSLHYVPEMDSVLARLAEMLGPGGRMVIVEYEQEVATRWVPYPVPASRLPALASAAGLSPFVVTATRPSAFGGFLYAATAGRPVVPAARRPETREAG
jgi:ubiquinone/menaquinone biosynthesis C-methylase UbiE